MKITTTILLLLHFSTINSQICPNNLNGNQQNNSPVTLYIFNISNEVIGSTVCHQAGANMNCNLESLPPNTSYLSFYSAPLELGSCIYDTTGSLIGALPISLEFFKVEVFESCNKIKWKTLSEINNNYFTLEGSEDGIHWRVLFQVDGAGNSSPPKLYTYNDYKGFNTIYYKLTQYDLDGVSGESFVVTALNDSPKHLVCIYNLLGQKVDESYEGVKVYLYSDGTYKKKYNDKENKN